MCIFCPFGSSLVFWQKCPVVEQKMARGLAAGVTSGPDQDPPWFGALGYGNEDGKDSWVS